MLTYFSCTHSCWFKRWGKKTDQPNIFIFVAKTNAKINISRLTFQNYLTLDEHCVQPFCTRMSTVSHLGENKNQCKTAATDLSTSVIQCSAFTDNGRESWIPKDFTVYVLFLVLSTCTESLTNVHFPLDFTLCLCLMKMYLKYTLYIDWLWRVLVPVNQIS